MVSLSRSRDDDVIDALAAALRSFDGDRAIDGIVFDLDLVALGNGSTRKHGRFHFFAVYRADDGSPNGFGFYPSDDAASLALTNRRALGGVLPPGAASSPGASGPDVGFAVKTFADWSDDAAEVSYFAKLGDAMVFAAGSTRPLIDLVDLTASRVIAARRAIPFPGARPDPADPFVPRDDFPGGTK